MLIDQHSAHERVLYEEFMKSLESGRVPAQRLLLPLTLHLGPAESDAFEANRDYLAHELQALGFKPLASQGTYFLTTDISGLRFNGSDVDFCKHHLHNNHRTHTHTYISSLSYQNIFVYL